MYFGLFLLAAIRFSLAKNSAYATHNIIKTLLFKYVTKPTLHLFHMKQPVRSFYCFLAAAGNDSSGYNIGCDDKIEIISPDLGSYIQFASLFIISIKDAGNASGGSLLTEASC